MNNERINPVNMVALEIFGVDPGISNGGIAKYKNGKIETFKMSDIKEFEQLCDFWRDQKERCKRPFIFLEKISTFKDDLKNVPKEKRNEFIGSQRNVDKLKTHFVELRSAIKLSGISYIEVMPYHWQNYIHVYIAGEDYKIRKKRFKDIAKDKFLNVKVTDAVADALLLVDFGRRKLHYDMLWVMKYKKNGQTKSSIFNS